MPTTFCPKCGQQVQPGVAFCPHCGTRLAATDWLSPQQPQKDSGKTVIIVLLATLIGILIAAGIYFLVRSLSDDSTPTPTQQTESQQPGKDTVVVIQREQATSQNRQTNIQAPATTPAHPTQVVVTGTNVRLRLSPYINSRNPNDNTLTYTNGTNVHPRKGEALRYLGEEGDFYYVEYKGYLCYIAKQFSYLR